MDCTTKTASDDEEDLEQLRLAALQTIKKPCASNTQNNLNKGAYYKKTGFNGLSNKRGRGFHGGQGGRPLRNGQFTNRTRNTNLIPIQTVQSDSLDSAARNSETENTVPKLVRPQDRYCLTGTNSESKSSEATSKFSRYDNSDRSDSESESESEIEVSDPESPKPGKLERSDSLEALMQELENEIEGDSKPKPTKRKVKVKKPKKVKEDVTVEQKENIIVENQPAVTPKAENEAEKPISDVKSDVKVSDENTAVNSSPPKSAVPQRYPRKPYRNMHKPRLPERRPLPLEAVHVPPYVPQDLSVIPPPYFVHGAPIVNQCPFPPHLPPFVPNEQMMAFPPPQQRYGRPLSPLTLSTDILSTTVSAPLSPRSAAFVLQNREIIERRKRSPRSRAERSYSRSPSPRFRRSKSPRRSSVSPLRDPLSPRQRYSPVRKHSPARRMSPKRTSPTSKSSVYNRLGAARKRKSRSISLSLSPSPERTTKPLETEVKTLDPVLEARKRKFESNEIKVKEGVIRLKPKSEETSEKSQKNEGENVEVPETNEDEDNLLDMHVDDLFSDEEESDGENEGRFKTSSQQSRKNTVLPFTQLLKSSSSAIKDSALIPERKRERDRTHRESTRKKRSPLVHNNKHETKTTDSKKYRTDSSSPRKVSRSTEPVKNRIVLKGDKPKSALVIAEKKIEIKIRNPTKYEQKNGEEKEKVVRKVEMDVAEEKSDNEDDHEPEIIVDNEEDDEDVMAASDGRGGDLRAQLSRKRAERQNKISLVDGVPSRLLQTALESAVFKKTKKRTKETSSTPKELEAVKRIMSASSDTKKSWTCHRKVHVLCSDLKHFVRIAQEGGKLPIRSRLGIATNVDIFGDVAKKKRKRNKNRNGLEQV